MLVTIFVLFSAANKDRDLQHAGDWQNMKCNCVCTVIIFIIICNSQRSDLVKKSLHKIKIIQKIWSRNLSIFVFNACNKSEMILVSQEVLIRVLKNILNVNHPWVFLTLKVIVPPNDWTNFALCIWYSSFVKTPVHFLIGHVLHLHKMWISNKYFFVDI